MQKQWKQPFHRPSPGFCKCIFWVDAGCYNGRVGCGGIPFQSLLSLQFFMFQPPFSFSSLFWDTDLYLNLNLWGGGSCSLLTQVKLLSVLQQIAPKSFQESNKSKTILTPVNLLTSFRSSILTSSIDLLNIIISLFRYSFWQVSYIWIPGLTRLCTHLCFLILIPEATFNILFIFKKEA